MKLLPLAIAATLTFMSGTVAANINSEMNRQFGSMQNLTQPAIVIGPEGGVVSGGGLTVRMPVRSMEGPRIVPPGGRAGCGGIDLQGGSLSFPSAKEFVGVARAVAGNVGGYAFKLALSTICQSCENVMSEIQNLNNLFNKGDLDSCTIAEDIVNNQGQETMKSAAASARAIGTAFKEITSSDKAEASNQNKARAPASEMTAEQRRESFVGNYIWDALVRTNGVFEDVNSSTGGNEAMMSLIGAVVVCASEEDSCPELKPGERQGEGQGYRRERTLSLGALMAGGNQSVFKCNDSNCLDVSVVNRNIGKSLEKIVIDAFVKEDGIIERVSASAADSKPLTAAQSRMLSQLGSFGTKVVQISRSGKSGKEAAETFVINFSRHVVAAYYADTVSKVLSATRLQLERDMRPGTPEAMEMLRSAEAQLHAERQDFLNNSQVDGMVDESYKRHMASTGVREIVLNATQASMGPQ